MPTMMAAVVPKKGSLGFACTTMYSWILSCKILFFFYSFVAQPSWPLIQGNPFHHTIVNMFCLHHHLYHLFSLGAKSPCNAAFVATWLLHYSHHGHSDSAMFSFHVWQSWWPLFAKQCHIIHEICHQKFWPHLIALQIGFHCIHVAPYWPFRSLPQWEPYPIP